MPIKQQRLLCDAAASKQCSSSDDLMTNCRAQLAAVMQQEQRVSTYKDKLQCLDRRPKAKSQDENGQEEVVKQDPGMQQILFPVFVVQCSTLDCTLDIHGGIILRSRPAHAAFA